MLTSMSMWGETDIQQILMDFVSLMVISEISKWFGILFEKYLKTFYGEVSTIRPDYLQIQVTHLDQVVAYILGIAVVACIPFYWIPFGVTTLCDQCPNKDAYLNHLEEGKFYLTFGTTAFFKFLKYF